MHHHRTQEPGMGSPAHPLPAGVAPLGTPAAAPGVDQPPDTTKDEAPAGANGGGSMCDAKTNSADSPATSASMQGLPVQRPVPKHLSNPRHVRALRALLTGPKRNAEIRAEVGALNGPNVIRELRLEFGMEIHCHRFPTQDRDGRTVRIGEYRLTSADRLIAHELLRARSRNDYRRDAEGCAATDSKGAK